MRNSGGTPGEERIMKDMIRALAIELLDDEHGIKESAMELLGTLLKENGEVDILDAVKATEGRFYLMAETADLFRQ